MPGVIHWVITWQLLYFVTAFPIAHFLLFTALSSGAFVHTHGLMASFKPAVRKQDALCSLPGSKTISCP